MVARASESSGDSRHATIVLIVAIVPADGADRNMRRKTAGSVQQLACKAPSLPRPLRISLNVFIYVPRFGFNADLNRRTAISTAIASRLFCKPLHLLLELEQVPLSRTGAQSESHESADGIRQHNIQNANSNLRLKIGRHSRTCTHAH